MKATVTATGPCACLLFHGRSRAPSSTFIPKVSDLIRSPSLLSSFRKNLIGHCLLFSFFHVLDEELPMLMACLMGLQHAMAMIGGLITPPLVVIKFTVCGFAQGFCPDLVQVSSHKRILLMKSRQIDSVVASHFCRFWDQFFSTLSVPL